VRPDHRELSGLAGDPPGGIVGQPGERAVDVARGEAGEEVARDPLVPSMPRSILRIVPLAHRVASVTLTP
jgi:hypothetical protein